VSLVELFFARSIRNAKVGIRNIENAIRFVQTLLLEFALDHGVEGRILIFIFKITVVVEIQSFISILWAYSLLSFWVWQGEPKLKQIRHFPIWAVKVHLRDIGVIS
jgi:hypothetical protein